MSTTITVHCDGCDCTAINEAITYIDDKGYVYCTRHGVDRKSVRRCRKLTPAEQRTIRSGEPIAKY